MLMFIYVLFCEEWVDNWFGWNSLGLLRIVYVCIYYILLLLSRLLFINININIHIHKYSYSLNHNHNHNHNDQQINI